MNNFILVFVLGTLPMFAISAQEAPGQSLDDPSDRRASRLATLARRAGYWHDPEEAASLLEQAVALAPGQPEHLADLASTYRLLGKLDAAIAPYEASLVSSQQRTEIGVDPTLLADMAALFKALGELDQFEPRVHEILGGNLNGATETAVQAGIAIAKHRFDQATALLLEVFQERKDQSTFDLLLKLGEYQGDVAATFHRLQAIAALDGFGNLFTFAEQALAAGDFELAVELWRACIEGEGDLCASFAIEGLCEYGFVAEAEALYQEYRPRFEELDETALEMYQQGTGFQEVAAELLQETSESRLQRLSRPFWDYTQCYNDRYRATAYRLLELNPAHEELTERVMDILERCHEPLAAMRYAEQLYEVNPWDYYHQRAYADGLCLANREAEALALYDTALEMETNKETIDAALHFYLHRGHMDKVRMLRERAANALEAEELAGFDESIARYGAHLGKAGDYAELLSARFESEPIVRHFEEYLWFLDESGYGREACKLFMDPGHAEQSAGVMRARTRLPDAIVHYGDFRDVANLVDTMRVPNDAHTYRQKLALNVRAFRELGHSWQILDALRRNELTEEQPNSVFVDFLADEFLRSGDMSGAFALIERLLEENPMRLDLLEKKADILARVGHEDEAITVLQVFTPGLGLYEESQRAVKLIRSYFDAGLNAEALVEVESLSAWNRFGDTASDIGAILVEEGHYAAALPHLERALTQRVPDESSLINLVRCHAELGDIEGAWRAWNTHQRRFESKWLANELERPHFRRVAPQIYEDLLAVEPHKIEYWHGYFGVLLAGENATRADGAFQRALETLPAERFDEIVQGYGRCIAEFGDLAARLDAPPAGDRAMLQALAAGYACMPRGLQTRELWKKVAALPLDDAAYVVFVERSHPGPAVSETDRIRRELNQEEIARARKLDGILQGAITDYARGVEGRIPALRYLIPEFIDTDITTWELAIEHGEHELAIEALAAVRERRPDSDAVAFCDTLEPFLGGRGQDTSGIRSFAQTAVLELWHWRVLGNLFHRKDDTEGEILVLERIASAGYDAAVRDRALAALCEAYSRAGDAGQAFARFLELSPSYRDREACFETIAKRITAEDLTRIEGILVRMNADWPGNLTVSEGFGRLSELAERFGVSFDLSEKLDLAGLSDMQRQDVAYWPALYEGWVLSPAYEGVDPGTFMSDKTMAAALNDTGAPVDTSGWTRLDLSKTLGMIDGLGALFSGAEDSGDHGAYPFSSIRFEEPQDTYYESPPAGDAGALAYTTVESENGGQVELTVASSRTGTQIWLNGERVYTTVDQLQVHPGQARFLADFKPGINHIVLKCLADVGGWNFCLGPAHPGKLAISADTLAKS